MGKKRAQQSCQGLVFCSANAKKGQKKQGREGVETERGILLDQRKPARGQALQQGDTQTRLDLKREERMRGTGQPSGKENEKAKSAADHSSLLR